ncbi:MAG: DUF2752 domain-containing protein [Alloprevotella sp.]|nr:DUF2752 domain-containing protein [Alloprevotella sp.]
MDAPQKTSQTIRPTPSTGRRWDGWLFAGGAAAVLVTLYFLNPTESRIAPKCIWKLLTGFDCPGCGFQRAIHAMLHGHFAEAAGYNLFLLFALPYLAAVVLSDWVLRGETALRWRRVTHSSWLLWAYVVLFFAWWIVRNILGI